MIKRAFWSGLASLAMAGSMMAQESAPPPDQMAQGLAQPLGAPQAAYPVSLPTDRNAFPADIMTRMRAALVAQADNPQAPRPVRPND